MTLSEELSPGPVETIEDRNSFEGATPPGPAAEVRRVKTPAAADDERFCLDWPTWAARLLMLNSKLVRSRIIGHPKLPEEGPIIYAHWHCEDLSMLPYFGYAHSSILVSQSRDGAMLSRAVKVMGYESCRGSSSRGGLGGLLALKRSLENGQSVVLAADGPRGPRGVAKAGPLYLAAKTGCPIYPTGSACSWRHVFKGTWSKTGLPLPGSRLVMFFNPPMYFPPEATRWPTHVQSRIITAAIEDAVQAARRELDRWMTGGDRGAINSKGA